MSKEREAKLMELSVQNDKKFSFSLTRTKEYPKLGEKRKRLRERRIKACMSNVIYCPTNAEISQI
jgi:hypothetical protein